MFRNLLAPDRVLRKNHARIGLLKDSLAQKTPTLAEAEWRKRKGCGLVLMAIATVPAALFWRLLVASTVMIASAYLGAAGHMSPTLGFLISAAGGLYILGEIYLGEASKINANSGNQVVQSAFNALRLIATIGWAIYPLGYFMEYLGGGVDPMSLNVIYNLADFLNKIAFGLVIYRAAVTDSA